MKSKKVLSCIIAATLLFTMIISSGLQALATDQDGEITIYLTRHGKTMLNTASRSQGWADSPLTPPGVEVAEYLGIGLALSDITFDKVYSSDSSRAVETAEIVLANSGQSDLTINKDKRFREHCFGTYDAMEEHERFNVLAEFKGMTYDEYMSYLMQNGFSKPHADDIAALDKGQVEEGVNWPAEDYETIENRLVAGLNDVVADAKSTGDTSILITSHGMSIGTLLTALDPSVKVGQLKNASMCKVVYSNGEFTVETVNDMTYVDLGQEAVEDGTATPVKLPNSVSSDVDVTTLKDTEEITIYFTRHGKTMLNTVHRGQGWIDTPLTPAGVEVAEYLGKGLGYSNIEFDKVYSSDSSRAIETAEIVLANNGQSNMAINKDKRLREHNFGTYEGMYDSERLVYIAAEKGMTVEEFQAYMGEKGFAAVCFEHADILAELDAANEESKLTWAAESSEEIVDRLTEVLNDIVATAIDDGDNSILVTSHGMSIITLLYSIDPTAELPAGGLSNASVSKVVYKDGAFKVETANDMSYVELGKNPPVVEPTTDEPTDEPTTDEPTTEPATGTTGDPTTIDTTEEKTTSANAGNINNAGKGSSSGKGTAKTSDSAVYSIIIFLFLIVATSAVILVRAKRIKSVK